jgi:type VI secretion system secreted protein VgrG
MSVTQAHRFAAIKSPLGEDVLLLRTGRVFEQLGRPFQIDLELFSEERELEFAQLLGQDLTIELRSNDGSPIRYFNGIVSRFTQSGEATSEYVIYNATVVPKLWLLTRQADCRIFYAKSIPQILKKIFDDEMRGATVKYALKRTYPALDFCVQYRETTFNFVSRLMEQEGIYYFFDHADGEHTMIVTDDIETHQTYPDYEKIRYHPDADPGAFSEAVREFSWALEVQTGFYSLNEFDFQTPKKKLLAQSQVEFDADLRVFDYPGDYVQPADKPGDRDKDQKLGDDYAKVRLEELQSQRLMVTGRSDAVGLCTGFKFTLTEHKYWGESDWLVTGAEYQIRNNGYFGGEQVEGDSFGCHFTAIFAEGPFRPARLTPKPVIQGPQTALVVGPPGAEIHTDKYGRVRVHFHWEHGEHALEQSSFWVRVAQIWAGTKWGAIHIPRVGQEVIVEFLEGDPDRPIITGRVYNGDAMPPHDLPAKATISCIKSNTSKGGGGFNEIRFEDEKGHEQIFIHGQKRMDVRVRGSVFETNYGNREVRVGWESDGESGGQYNVLVKEDHNQHIKGSLYEMIEKDLNQCVKGAVVEDYQDNHTTMVKNNITINAKKLVVEMSDTVSHKAGTFIAEGTQAMHLKATSVNIEATQGISLKVGGNFVSITPTGVSIMGTMVMINSGGAGMTANPAVAASPVEITDPQDAAAADTGEPGSLDRYGGGGGGGGGARPWRRRTLDPQHAPPPPPPPIIGRPPLPVGPIPVVPEDPTRVKKFLTIEWAERESWCSERATLRGTTENYGDGESETASVRKASDGQLFKDIPLNIRGNAYSETVDCIDILPVKAGANYETFQDYHATAAGKRTPEPLKMRFIPNLARSSCPSGRFSVATRFSMVVNNYEMTIEGNIRYIKGWAREIIDLAGVVANTTGGVISGDFLWQQQLAVGPDRIDRDATVLGRRPIGSMFLLHGTILAAQSSMDAACGKMEATIPPSSQAISLRPWRDWNIDSGPNQTKLTTWARRHQQAQVERQLRYQARQLPKRRSQMFAATRSRLRLLLPR